MDDSEDEFTQKRINHNTGSQFPDVSAFLEDRNNLELTLNDNEGLHAVEAAGDGANNGALDDGADPGAGGPVFVAGSEQAPQTIWAAAPPPPKGAHMRFDPKMIVGLRQTKLDKMCFGGYR